MRRLIWLMSRFQVSPELIGDITEDAARHSPLWLLRQSTAAILSALRSGFWHNKFETISALAVGWILWFVVSAAIPRLVDTYAQYLTLTTGWAFVTGHAVARAHREQPLGASLLFMTTQFLAMAIGVARIIEHAYWVEPILNVWPYLLQVLIDASLLLATFLGALTGSRRRVAA